MQRNSSQTKSGAGFANKLLAKKREVEALAQAQASQAAPLQPGAGATAAAAGGGGSLVQKVGRVKAELGLDASLAPAAAVAEANEVMGIAPQGTLVNQVNRLLQDLGIA